MLGWLMPELTKQSSSHSHQMAELRHQYLWIPASFPESTAAFVTKQNQLNAVVNLARKGKTSWGFSGVQTQEHSVSRAISFGPLSSHLSHHRKRKEHSREWWENHQVFLTSRRAKVLLVIKLRGKPTTFNALLTTLCWVLSVFVCCKSSISL